MLVQLVCLDRRYQRMNCYNIREIQTLLKSKYSPSSADSADVHFNLNETALGLRYQIGGLNFLDPSIFTYYRNSLTSNPRYRAFHEFLNKPIVEFDSVKMLLSKSSLMYSVLRSLYKDEAVDFQSLFASSPVMTTGGLTAVLDSHVIPSTGSSNHSLRTLTSQDFTLLLYSIHPGTLRDQLISTFQLFDSFDLHALFSGLKSCALG